MNDCERGKRRGHADAEGAGPLVAAAGLMLLRGLDEHITELLPGVLVFSAGLTVTVAPLTATVLADADEADAGIASAVNNAVARIASLIGISVVGIIVAKTLVGDSFGANHGSVRAFEQVTAICAGLLAAGGLAGAIGIVNPKRPPDAEGCPGGQLFGAPRPAIGSVDHSTRAQIRRSMGAGGASQSASS